VALKLEPNGSHLSRFFIIPPKGVEEPLRPTGDGAVAAQTHRVAACIQRERKTRE